MRCRSARSDGSPWWSSPTSACSSPFRAAGSSFCPRATHRKSLTVSDVIGGRGGRLFLILLGLLGVALLFASPAWAQSAGGQPGALDRALTTISGDGRPLSLSLQVLILMSLLTVLPSLILMMTSFTRIIIVLSILRQALGLQQTPPNQVLVGLALFLSIFVMSPFIERINETAFTPYGDGAIPIEEAVTRSGDVLHGFMIGQTRETDLKLFADIADARSEEHTSELQSLMRNSYAVFCLKKK